MPTPDQDSSPTPPRVNKPILCVDFDGVIHSYSSGWKGADVVLDPPVPGAIRWLWKATKWWNVQIYSSRTSQPGGIGAMQSWLLNFAIHELGDKDVADQFMNAITFPEQKPPAFLTIDDRAICFEGDWSKLDPATLINFKPWNKRQLSNEPSPPPDTRGISVRDGWGKRGGPKQ